MSPLPESLSKLPVVVIGGGPVGLAALAQLLDRQMPALLLEAGPEVGAHFRQYGSVRLFSPWKFNIAEPVRAQLAATGWTSPPDDALPLAREIVDVVLAPFAHLPHVAPHIQTNHRVRSITRLGFDKVKTDGREAAPFEILIDTPEGEQTVLARAVIDASGTWSSPNPMGASGIAVPGEAAAADRVFYGIPDILERDRPRYAGKRVLVLGAGHTAANALLWLTELSDKDPATSIVWAVRGRAMARAFGGGAADQLPARGELGTRLRQLVNSGRLRFERDFKVREVVRDGSRLSVIGAGSDGTRRTVADIDEIICATGQRPDLSMTRELRLKLDPSIESTEALGPLIDPNVHSCGSVPPHGHRELAHPEHGFYTVGVKSYGRAPTFLMMTGYEQVRSVVAALAGDLQSADAVELVLPETGVCSTTSSASDSNCCGVPEPVKVSAKIAVRRNAPVLVTEDAAGCGKGC